MVDFAKSDILNLKKITKTFGDFRALKNVTFSLQAGEVHSLLGENGAGKSTLMNVAAGLYTADSGEILFDDELVYISGPNIAKDLGIGMVHQHYKLVEKFTAIQNIELFLESHKFRRSHDSLRKQVLSICDDLGFNMKFDIPVGEMSVAEQQRVEILKTLLLGARVIILDEPTSVLTDAEAMNFFDIIKSLAAKGTAIVLVTHKMKEALEYSDRISVMRDGELLETLEPSKTSRAELVKLIVGEISESSSDEINNKLGAEILSLDKVSLNKMNNSIALHDISFSVRSGEILGIAGIGGNGQSELVELLSGLKNVNQGKIIWKKTRDLSKCKPNQMRSFGLSTIPADRKKYALAGNLSIYENFGVSGILEKLYGRFLIKLGLLRSVAKEAVSKYDIQGVNSIRQNAALLSGGNAQKLVVAREFNSKPSLIVAHSPSRGLDLKAAASVHSNLKKRVKEGASVILISEDLDEIFLLSNRIAVLHSGRITGIFDRSDGRQKVGNAMVQ